MEITLIRKVRNDTECFLGYEIIIETDEAPDLRVGKCEVKNIGGK